VECSGTRDKLLLYAEWKATGKPLDEAAAWLDQRLNDTFLFLKNPPVWVEDEPSWPFFEGKPMVFLSQTMDSSPVGKSALSPGETVYLFAARQKYKTGFKMHFEVVSQFAALKSRNG
jgi:hypothetical protein